MKKEIGYMGEEIALDYYLNKGYELKQKNFCMRGGEIDIILKKELTILFVEVKVVDAMDDLIGYLTPKKLQNLKKSIKYYMSIQNISNKYEIRIDFVFIKNGQIYEVYENMFI